MTVSTQNVQLLFSIIGPFLIRIYDACLKLNYFPTSWKKAVVLVLPKANKPNYLEASAYRPISLLPIMGKILEKIILNRIQPIAESQSWISENQHGFRKGKSTITALEELTHDIQVGFRKKMLYVLRLTRH